MLLGARGLHKNATRSPQLAACPSRSSSVVNGVSRNCESAFLRTAYIVKIGLAGIAPTRIMAGWQLVDLGVSHVGQTPRPPGGAGRQTATQPAARPVAGESRGSGCPPCRVTPQPLPRSVQNPWHISKEGRPGWVSPFLVLNPHSPRTMSTTYNGQCNCGAITVSVAKLCWDDNSHIYTCCELSINFDCTTWFRLFADHLLGRTQTAPTAELRGELRQSLVKQSTCNSH